MPLESMGRIHDGQALYTAPRGTQSRSERTSVREAHAEGRLVFEPRHFQLAVARGVLRFGELIGNRDPARRLGSSAIHADDHCLHHHVGVEGQPVSEWYGIGGSGTPLKSAEGSWYSESEPESHSAREVRLA